MWQNLAVTTSTVNKLKHVKPDYQQSFVKANYPQYHGGGKTH